MREKCTPHKNLNFPHHLTIFIMGLNHVPTSQLCLKSKFQRKLKNYKLPTYLAMILISGLTIISEAHMRIQYKNLIFEYQKVSERKFLYQKNRLIDLYIYILINSYLNCLAIVYNNPNYIFWLRLWVSTKSNCNVNISINLS